jgi:soluble lytic murein transglycosylase-like protein
MKSISRNTPGLLAATLLLAACTTVPAPEYSRQHPANPDATQAPATSASSALDTYQSAAARKEPPGQSTTPEGQNGQGNSRPRPAGKPGEDGHDHH